MVMYLLRDTVVNCSTYISFFFYFNSSYRKRTSYERKHFLVKTEPFRGNILHLITRNKCDS